MKFEFNTRTILIAIAALAGIAFLIFRFGSCGKKSDGKTKEQIQKETIQAQEAEIFDLTKELDFNKVLVEDLRKLLDECPKRIEPRVLEKTKIVEKPIFKYEPDPNQEKQIIELSKTIENLLQAASDNELFFEKQEETIAKQADIIDELSVIKEVEKITLFQSHGKQLTSVFNIRGRMIGEPSFTLESILKNQIEQKKEEKEYKRFLSFGVNGIWDNSLTEPANILLYDVGYGKSISKRLSLEGTFIFNRNFDQLGVGLRSKYHF